MYLDLDLYGLMSADRLNFTVAHILMGYRCEVCILIEYEESVLSKP